MKKIDHADLMVEPGRTVNLADFDPRSTSDFKTKHDAQAKLSADIVRLAALQDVFAAQERYGLLIIFQGMDSAGKDGAIKHVMTGVNPQGVDVPELQAAVHRRAGARLPLALCQGAARTGPHRHLQPLVL